MVLDLQQRRQRASETGNDILPAQHGVSLHDRLGTILAIDAGQAALWIHDPHEAGSGVEPVAYLREDFTGAIAGGPHFDDEVRSEVRVAGRLGLVESRPRNAMSGARTVSGALASLNPVSAAYT